VISLGTCVGIISQSIGGRKLCAPTVTDFVHNVVVCQVKIDGYNLVNLIRASSVVNCQSTGEED
jgi:hypothetical protein